MNKILLGFALMAFGNSSSFAASGSSAMNNLVGFGTKLDGDTPSKALAGASLANTITLVAGDISVTGGNYYRLVKMGAGTSLANYQVTAGKVLYCSGAWIYSTGLITFTMGYGTTAVTNNNNTAPSGNVVFGNSSATRTFTMAAGSAQGTHKWFPFFMSFPAASFPYVQARDAVEFGMTLLCEEQ